MPRERKEGPTLPVLRVLLKKNDITLEDLQNLKQQKPHLFGEFEDREELEALCRANMAENDNHRAELLIDQMVDASYWHGYEVRSEEADEEIKELKEKINELSKKQ